MGDGQSWVCAAGRYFSYGICHGWIRWGYGRVDFLFGLVIAIVLVSLLAPGILRLRETARLRNCQDNLRRIGIALRSYSDQFSCLPPASFWDDAEMILDSNMRPAREPDQIASTRANWMQLLLPFVDENEVGKGFASGVAITDEANAAARTTMLSLMICPSDRYATSGNAYLLTDSHGAEFRFARGNYAINGGSQINAEWPGRLSFPVTDGNVLLFRSRKNVFQWWGNGVAGFNHSFSLDEFKNGLNNTVAVDEIRAGIVPEDPRGAWALGQIGSSITWAHGVNGDAFGPNNQLVDSDDILEGRAVARKYGMRRFVDAHMPFCAHCSYSNQATARSLHVAGVNVLMADGSHRFVSDSISPSLWHVLHSRETPRDVLDSLTSAEIAGSTNERSHRHAATAADVESKHVLNGEQSNSAHPERADRLQNSLGMALVLIPPGRYTMASPDANNTWPYPKLDVPPHEVRITRGFHMGECEVTQRQFETVMGMNPSWHCVSGGGSSSVEGVDTSDFPVEDVTWDAAMAFCRRLSELTAERHAGRIYRLPTEAEWEYVCRGGLLEAPWFDADWREEDDFAEIAGKERHPTKEPLVPKLVGSFPPNAFGVCDMRGNVFEWCSDWFERGYYARSPVDDPQGPSSGFLKVIRGWDWVFIGPQCKDFLFVTPPWKANPYVGFRVVCEIAGESGKSGRGTLER